jgi:hypothetical protein
MDNSKKIKELESELRLKKEQVAYTVMPVEHQLADMLHSKLCHLNHTDRCGWHYESWTRIGTTRQSYIDKAKAILKIVDFDTAKKVINLL